MMMMMRQLNHRMSTMPRCNVRQQRESMCMLACRAAICSTTNKSRWEHGWFSTGEHAQYWLLVVLVHSPILQASVETPCRHSKLRAAYTRSNSSAITMCSSNTRQLERYRSTSPLQWHRTAVSTCQISKCFTPSFACNDHGRCTKTKSQQHSSSANNSACQCHGSGDAGCS